MKKYETIVGIDVAKLKLDVAIVTVDPETKNYLVIENTSKAIKALLKKIKGSVLYCFEHTGNYTMPLCCTLQEMRIDYCMVPGLTVKKSKGISRGRNDKADSFDLAEYAITHQHNLRLTTLADIDIQKIKLLLTEREKLVKSIKSFKMTKENESFLPRNILKQTLLVNNKTVRFLKNQLKAIELEINKVAVANNQINHQLGLLVSIPGIGQQTALNLIVVTHGFTLFKTWRQLACYAGVAPFEHSSGSSIKGRTKVSHLANKKIKSLLNMAALSAKKSDHQIKEYFNRKVREGKNKMLVLNNIRCKLLGRAFAVINRGTPYVNTEKYLA